MHQHAAQSWIERQLREFTTEWRELMRVVEAAEFVQQIVTRANRGAGGRIDEGEGLDLAKLEGFHAQNDLGEVRPLDFRHGEAIALLKVILFVKADAQAIAHATGAAGTLIRAALRHRFHRQALGPRAWIVATHAGEAGIDHHGDARNGDGGLRDVRGDHDATFAPRLKHALLLR